MTTALMCALLALSQAAPPSKLGDEDVPTAEPERRAATTADPLADIALAIDTSQSQTARVAAIDRLAGSDDARVTSILVTLTKDRTRNVQLAAVRALGADPSARANESLISLVNDARTPFPAREEAIRALGARRQPAAADALEGLVRDEKLLPSLRQLAQKQLEGAHPERAASVKAATPSLDAPSSSTSGLSFRATHHLAPMALGAGFGSYALWTVGILGQNEAGGALGFITGAALGGAAGYLLANEMTPMQAIFYGTGTGFGLWAGLGAGLVSLQNQPDDRLLHLFGLGGELIGATASYLLWEQYKDSLDAPGARPDPGFAVSGALVAAPALHLIATLDDRRQGHLTSHVLELNTFFKVAALGSGIALGAGVGALLGRRFNDERGNYVATGTAWGLGLGMLTAAASIPDANAIQIEGVGTLAALAGLGVGLSTWAPGLNNGDLATINTLGALGGVAGLGLSLLASDSSTDPRLAAGIVTGGSLLGLAGGRLVTRSLEFKGTDTGLLGLVGAHAGLVSLLAPDFFGSVDGEARAGTFLLGTTAGVLTGGLLAQQLDLPPRAIGAMFLGDFFGSVAGWGAGLLATRSDAPLAAVHAPILLLGTAGLVGGALLSDDGEADTGDTVIVPVAAALGLWNGMALSLGTASSFDDRNLGGAALLGAGVGGLGGLVLSKALTLEPQEVAAASSGALWGTYLSLSTLLALPRPLEQQDLLLIVAASDIGLGVTSFLMSPSVGARPIQVGVASLFGLGGAAATVLGASLFTQQAEVLIAANLFGAVAGLGIGAFVAARLPESIDPGKQSGGGGGGFGTFPGLPIRFQNISPAPMLDSDGRMGGGALVASFEND